MSPFRDQVVIESKFGWNIDLENGERRPGLNSRAAHVKQVVEGMLRRGPEEVIIPLCQEAGIGFVPWSPLGVGFLTAAIDASTRFATGDIRAVESRISPESLPHTLALVELVERWAERKGAALAQIALAWLTAQKPWIVPIPGTTQMAHMLGNIGGAEVRLTSAELADFDKGVSAIEICGARLPDQVLASSGVGAPRKR